ncbi:MAG: YaiO family outer membrane beta-barrel protein [Candidatus Dadabacteria bacterium]|nr:MAG: YaiO family outer membrane beta-barrel protein [Candidatus Dadabacteria bacterium]
MERLRAAAARARPRAVLPGARRGYRASLEYQVEDFDRDFSAWHQAVVGLERRADWGSLIGRVNYLSRFGRNAAQFDFEAYRDVAKGTYVNVAAALATDEVLPDYSFLVELYRALGGGFEASGGVRFIGFDAPTRVYTGSIGIYRGRYWAALRPLVTSNRLGTTLSWTAKLRRYFADEEEYATLTLSRGRELEGTAATIDLFKLDTTAALLELRKRLAGHYVLKARGGYELQELPRRSDRSKVLIAAGVEYLF